MNTTFLKQTTRRFLLFALVPLLSLGCMQSPGSVPVNESSAADACQQFLDAWKDGQELEDLQPNIIGSDAAWASGQKLLSFEILPNEVSDGTNLHIPVKLSLKDEKGAEQNILVSYAVGTHPSITVIRDEEVYR